MIIYLTAPRCNGLAQTIYLGYNQNGQIKSPGYPNNYGNNENCQWLIQAPLAQKVLINFTAFELEDGYLCHYDSVTIFDGRNTSSPLLSKNCGSGLPTPVNSSGRYMYMQFKSDSSNTRKGFVAHYRAINYSSGKICELCSHKF